MSNENKDGRLFSKESVDEINKMFEDSLENGLPKNNDVLDMLDIVKAKTDPSARQRIIDLVERVRKRVANTTLNKKFGIKEGRESPVLNADLFLSEMSSEFEKVGLPRLDGIPIPPMDYPRVDPDPVIGEISINFEEVDLPWKENLPSPGVFDPFEELPTLHHRKLDLSELGETISGKFLPDGSVYERKVDWADVRSKGLAADFDGETPPGMFSIYELKDKYCLTRYPISRALIIVVFGNPCSYNPRRWPNCEDRLPSKTKFRKLSGRRKRLVAKMIEYGERRSELGMVKEYELSRK